jgi:hypothetical protein
MTVMKCDITTTCLLALNVTSMAVSSKLVVSRLRVLAGIFRSQPWYPPIFPRSITRQGLIAHCGKGNLWRGGLPRKHRSSIFPEDIQCFDSLKADILVTHEAPIDHPHGFQAIDYLAQSLVATTIIHGHHHDPFSYDDNSVFNIGIYGLMELDPSFFLLEHSKVSGHRSS